MKGTKNPEQAWEFLKWMTGKEAQLVMSKTGLFPTNLDALEVMKNDRQSFLYPYVEALDNAFLRPPVKNWSKIDEIFSEYMRKIFQGNLPVRQGLTKAAEEIDALLAASKR